MASKIPIRATRHTARCLYAPEHVVPRQSTRSLATASTPTRPQQSTVDAARQDRPLTRSASSSQITSLSSEKIIPHKHTPPPNPFIQTAHCTLHSFPQLEPVGIEAYPSTHLLLPLRRDILHRAVVFEADGKRQGTASTKWRSDVRGSGRKVRPQKGTGRARLGDKKSPMLRGGGVAFGPHPRDFSTDLPRKIYDLAWRTALSYRYRRGQLLVVGETADLDDIALGSRGRYLRDMMQWHAIDRTNDKTLIITEQRREALTDAFEDPRLHKEAQLLELEDVDVKDLLHLGRIIIEKGALDSILREHESDLTPPHRLGRPPHPSLSEQAAAALAEVSLSA